MILKTAISRIVCAVLRVEVVCPPEVVAALRNGEVLVSANHLSLIDGPLVALTSPVPLVFAVDTDYSRRSDVAQRGMNVLSRLGCGSVVPLDRRAPFGIRRLVAELRSGACVMVFPEGEISTGEPLPDADGLAWILARAAPARVHIKISGAEHSRLFAKRGRKWLPRITLEYSNR